MHFIAGKFLSTIFCPCVDFAAFSCVLLGVLFLLSVFSQASGLHFFWNRRTDEFYLSAGLDFVFSWFCCEVL